MLSKPPGDDPHDETRLAADETRLASTPRSSSVSSRPSSSGSITSSGIDHGRFPPGTILGGRYRIVGKLGKGGMGEVFRADDLKLSQQVALKFLPPEVDRDPARLTQLHTEVRMARQVSHPNVCRVYDIDEVEGHTFLSMEYVDGEDLSSLLKRIGRFNEDRGLEIARQLCAGLAAAHERGVIHRDFKPANVMIDGAGRVRITDFGLAGASGESIHAGTPAYMAPEQLGGGEVTARSDIYALGLVLYEIFTGRRALEASNLAELIRRREQAEIVPPSALTRDLSPDIDRAVMRCLAPDPAQRPPSALSVSSALPGGDPLAAALAAGETPSPQMVAAAGDADGGLRRAAGLALLVFAVAGLVATAAMANRTLLVGRVTFDKSPDVLEDRAQQIIARAGYDRAPGDTARGASIDNEYTFWISNRDKSPERWNVLTQWHAPLMRFWYRTSPREFNVRMPSWTVTMNDPPIEFSEMITVVVDDRGRLLEFVTMPPQLDTSPGPGSAVDWKPMFDEAGLAFSEFTAVTPNWTPRIYGEQRVAWEGPMRGFPDTKLRVEAASYAGKPVSFLTVWPWTRPSRMATPSGSLAGRWPSIAGTALVVAMFVGAVALVRYNLKSGRADRRGANRIATFLIGVWIVSWALGADHSLGLDTETNRFFGALAVALLNVCFTWLFYLALEPFVRRLCPDMLITWTRILAGQVTDRRVGRDVLIGCALGVLLKLGADLDMIMPIFVNDVPPQPRGTNLLYMFGLPQTLSALLRTIPNSLQGAMLGTFAYVMLLAMVRRRIVAQGLLLALFTGVVMLEVAAAPTWIGVAFGLLLGFPIIFVFARYGLAAVATALLVLQILNVTPLTVDLSRPHAAASSVVLLAVTAFAAYAFHLSGAGKGLFRRLMPA